MSAETQKERPSLLRFGEFTLDLERRGLYRSGERIRLTSKPLETLIFLVENRGRIVEKQELLDSVWKDTFVTEDTLVHSIREIRRALGDDKEDPRYVQTVPRQGYRFVGSIEAAPATEPQPEQGGVAPRAELTEPDVGVPAAAPEPTERRRSYRLRILALAVVTVCGAATVWIWRHWGDSRTQTARQRLVSTFPGSHRAASFAPDGEMIAYLDDVKGVQHVWVKHLDRGEPRQITSGELAAGRPRWSPAGDQIVFSLGVGLHPTNPSYGTESIWSVPAPFGGPPRKLINHGRNPGFSRDGSRLVFERGDEVWVSDADGGNQRKVEGVPPSPNLLADRMPAFSPDGTSLALFNPEQGPAGDFWVVPLSGDKPRRLTFDACSGSSPVWTPDGRWVLFASERSGSMTLWKAPFNGGEPAPLFGGAGEDTYPEITRDGGKIIYTNTRSTFTLKVLDPATQSTRDIFETRAHTVFPSFSPDGRAICFFMHGSEGESHIQKVDADGQHLVRVTQGKNDQSSFPHWSSDGSMIYYYHGESSASFRRISITGGQSVEMLPEWTWSNQYGTRVSSNGKLVLYAKYERGAPVATIIREIESGNETWLNIALDDPKWSSDDSFIVGTDLAAGAPPEGYISICAVNVGPCLRLTRGYNPVLSRDGSRVYFLRAGKSDGAELWSIGRDGQDEKRVGELRPMHPITHFYDVSSKGEIAWIEFRTGRQELWVADVPGS